MKYCRNCKWNNIFYTPIPFLYKIGFYLIYAWRFTGSCYRNVKYRRNKFNGSEIWEDEQIEANKRTNENGGCAYYKRKWWKRWIK